MKLPNKPNSIGWYYPELGQDEIDAVTKVIQSNYINDGEVSREFEARIAGLVGADYCITVTNGTSAITLALLAMGIGPGDKVIVPDFTFIATANAVKLAGAEVVLTDVDPDRMVIEVNNIQSVLTSEVKAILAVDVNGRSPHYHELESFAKKNGLALITDSAEAFGSKHMGQYMGTFGDAGCFSFSPNKVITSGQGGAIVTKSAKIYENLLALKDQGRMKQGSGGDDIHSKIGFNFKFTNLQAAIGLAQLKKLDSRINHSRNCHKWYTEALSSCGDVTFPPVEIAGGETLQWIDLRTEHKNAISIALSEANIGFRNFWHPIHTQQPYKLSTTGFPNTEKISHQGMWLSSNFNLTKNDIDYIAEIIISSIRAQ